MLRLARGNYLTPTPSRRDFPSARIIETTYRLGQHLPRHAHDHIYMVVVVSGALQETALGREHTLTRGGIVFNSAGEGHHDVVLAPGTRCLNIEFQTTFLSRLSAEGGHPRDPVRYACAGPAIGAVGKLHTALLSDDGQLDVEEALTELVGAVAPSDGSRRANQRWLPRALDFLHATFRRGVLLDEMAAVAGVHRTHLCRSFRAATGCTIGEYVRRLRADLACQRLVQGDGGLAGIAADCGFADQSHMTREVRRRYGRSPSRLRMIAAR